MTSIGQSTKQQFFDTALFIAILSTTLFCNAAIIRTAYADLKTPPPLVTLKKQSAQIANFMAKAETAVNETRLTTPAGNNAVYYAEQILALSPEDDRAVSILTKVINAYTSLVREQLGNNDIKAALMYQNKAEKIVRNFNIGSARQPLADLRLEILNKRAKPNPPRGATKKKSNTTKPFRLNQPMAVNTPLPEVDKLQSRLPEPPISQKMAQFFPEQQKTATKLAVKSTNASTRTDRLVAIVNSRNKVSGLTLRKLKYLFKGTRKTWANGETVTLFLPPPHSAAQLWLAQNVFQKRDPMSVAQFYVKALVRGEFLQIPPISTMGVIDVSRIHGGIAIVKQSEIDGSDSVKIIPINGM